MACFGFGTFHVIRLYCPRIWVSDPYRLTEKVQPVSPAWGAEGFDPFVLGGIASHHIVAAFVVVGTMWGGLFRLGSMDNRGGIVVGWLGHPVFRDKEGHELFVRYMPTFFETFLIVLMDGDELHIWYDTRTLFKDVFASIDPNLDAQVEFRAFPKKRRSN
ncbi:hypothetical protein ZIOFF_005939 [Zingiber officinale]|uniref:Photosystem II CP47 chlorophyll apoprotein n=1 Tax=Zingiber officinale TaxID=94328 RepID=A0A8J5I206_ZINOF|nr:hypothetical protein ZIOFF_005939 [Zingiber officinale]